MKKILVLGHTGMLGNCVASYISLNSKYILETTTTRWGTDEFKRHLKETDADVIINCIGKIPQKNSESSLYREINIGLPIFLESLSKKIIHPSTDCEFSGKIPFDKKYTKLDARDAVDEYGKSKAEISQLIEEKFVNTKIIRTSIIGHEINTHLSLLDWFLNAHNEVSGYTNHYWNGITTLTWAKLCLEIIDSWDAYPIVNQYGTSEVRSKYDLLVDIKNVYNKNK